MSKENKNLSNNPINRASMPKGVDDKENSFAPPEAVNSDVDIKNLRKKLKKNRIIRIATMIEQWVIIS